MLFQIGIKCQEYEVLQKSPGKQRRNALSLLEGIFQDRIHCGSGGGAAGGMDG